MRKSLVLILTFLLMTVISTQVLAVEAGGEVELSLSGSFAADGSFDSEFRESLKLELFIPQYKNNEVRYEFNLSQPVQDLMAEEEVSYFTRKLYLKHRFDDFHLTVGRQPVSWSFGSLINPVDYTLGAVAMDEESNSKYTDAVEAYLPINWNSNVILVTSFPGGFTTESEEKKWGLRGRMGFEGYDLTVNYVKEAEEGGGQAGGIPGISINSVIPGQRIGITAKGDIGDIGAYGAFGYYFDDLNDEVKNSKSYLLGADYSYNLNYNKKISMQLEYLGLELNSLDLSLRKTLLKMDSNDNRLDLMTGSLRYPIDDFSSFVVMGLANLDDGSFLLSPGYQNTLPGNIDLNLNLSVFLGENDSLFKPGEAIPEAVTSLSLSYPF